ncbi:hypothetical protein ACFL3Q_07675 [Planctomycetota bacterium]
MFWHAVKDGLSVLLYWETYLAGLEYFAIAYVPLIVFGILMERESTKAAMAVGFGGMFAMPVFQIAATAIFVLTLSPIILNISDDAAWSFPWRLVISAPGTFIRLVLILVVASVFIAFLPLLGGLRSLYVLVLGAITLMCVVALLEQIDPGSVGDNVEFMPSFWIIVGLLCVGGIMSWLGIMVAAALATLIGLANEDIAQFFMLPTAAVFGFIPVFIYGAWLSAQLSL